MNRFNIRETRTWSFFIKKEFKPECSIIKFNEHPKLKDCIVFYRESITSYGTMVFYSANYNTFAIYFELSDEGADFLDIDKLSCCLKQLNFKHNKINDQDWLYMTTSCFPKQS